MSIGARLQKLEAASGQTEEAFAVLDEHDQQREDAVQVQVPPGVGRLTEAEYRHRWPRGLLVFVRCFCEGCQSRRDDGEGGRWPR